MPPPYGFPWFGDSRAQYLLSDGEWWEDVAQAYLGSDWVCKHFSYNAYKIDGLGSKLTDDVLPYLSANSTRDHYPLIDAGVNDTRNATMFGGSETAQTIADAAQDLIDTLRAVSNVAAVGIGTIAADANNPGGNTMREAANAKLVGEVDADFYDRKGVDDTRMNTVAAMEDESISYDGLHFETPKGMEALAQNGIRSLASLENLPLRAMAALRETLLKGGDPVEVEEFSIGGAFSGGLPLREYQWNLNSTPFSTDQIPNITSDDLQIGDNELELVVDDGSDTHSITLNFTVSGIAGSDWVVVSTTEQYTTNLVGGTFSIKSGTGSVTSGGLVTAPASPGSAVLFAQKPFWATTANYTHNAAGGHVKGSGAANGFINGELGVLVTERCVLKSGNLPSLIDANPGSNFSYYFASAAGGIVWDLNSGLVACKDATGWTPTGFGDGMELEFELVSFSGGGSVIKVYDYTDGSLLHTFNSTYDFTGLTFGVAQNNDLPIGAVVPRPLIITEDAARQTWFEREIDYVPTPPDEEDPEGEVTLPATNATIVSGNVNFSGTCSDNVAVVGIQPKIDGANWGSEITGADLTSFLKTLDTLTVSNGLRTISFVLRDAATPTPNTATLTRTINVQNPPTAAFTLPATALVGESFTPTNTSTERGATTYIWDKENDGTTDSTEFEPEFSFDSAGVRTVRLRAVNSYGHTEATHTISIVPKTEQEGFELLQTKGSFGCVESISHAVLNADFGDGYEQTALIGSQTGLRSWRLKWDVLAQVLRAQNPFFDNEELNQADYLWDFYCRARALGQPFVIQSSRNGQYYLAKFVDENLSYELFACRLYTTGLALTQRRVVNASVFDLTKAPNALRVYDPNKLSYADEAAVVSFRDGMNNADLLAASGQPIYKTNIQNGNSVIRFSGTSNPLVSDQSLILRHIFLVASHSDASHTADSALLSEPENNFLINFSGENYYPIDDIFDPEDYPIEAKVNGVATELDSIPVPFQAWQLIELYFENPLTVSGLKLGSNLDGTVKHKGDVGDLFVSDKKLLESDVWEIREHLMKKWQIN